jgi:predicted nucleic acid-binding protein
VKILFDTSVLVSAILEQHPEHESSFKWLVKAHDKEFDWMVCAHSLLEFYAVLTSYPTKPAVAPGTARRLIQENIKKSAEIIELNVEDYSGVINDSMSGGFTGGVVYDALIFQAAVKSGADKLLTLNTSDFSRFSNQEKTKIVHP